jgi:hypothetical protein
MIADGQLPAVRVRSAVRIARADLERFVGHGESRALTATQDEAACQDTNATKTESTGAPTRRTGGPRLRTPAADRLGDLLAFAPPRTRKGSRHKP